MSASHIPGNNTQNTAVNPNKVSGPKPVIKFTRRAIFSALLSFIVISVAVIVGTILYQYTLADDARTRVTSNLNQHVSNIRVAFASRQTLLTNLAKLIETHSVEQLDREFSTIAESSFPIIKGVHSISLVINDQYRYVYPSNTDLAAKSFTQIGSSNLQSTAQSALKLQTMQFSAPFETGLGDYAMTGIMPVGKDNWLLLIEFATRPIFDESNLTANNEYNQPAIRTDSNILLLGESSEFKSNSQVIKLELANRTYEITNNASAAQLSRNASQLWGIRAIGIALALLSSALIYLIVDQAQTLQQAVYSRTSELITANQELEFDIVERKRAETALRQSQARNNALIAALPDLMFRVDSAGRYISVHAPPDIERELILPASELIGKHLNEVLSPAVADQIEQATKRALSTSQLQLIEYDLVPQTQTPTNFEARIINTDANEALVIVRNVTERKQAIQLLEKRVIERTTELRAMLGVSQQITSTIELKPLLNIVLKQVSNLIGFEEALLLTPQAQEFVYQAYQGAMLEADILGRRVTPEWAFTARSVIEVHNVFAINDIHRSNDAFPRKLRALVSPLWRETLQPMHALMGLPIELKDHTIGVLLLLHRKPGFYTEDKFELGLAIANQAAVAMDNALLYEQAQAVAVVEERQRLARDLHDAVTQTLFSASLIADILPLLFERDRAEGERRLEELRKFTRGALAEMRMLLLELRPTGLTDALLSELLVQLGEAATARGHIPVYVNASEEAALPPDVQITFYRIAQESLNNIVKHSQASRVDIELSLQPNQKTAQYYPNAAYDDEGRVYATHATILVRDNGRGFDQNNVPPTHMGLAIMRERAQSIDATLQIISQIKQGTQITFDWGTLELIAA